jgi:hypothetical protein
MDQLFSIPRRRLYFGFAAVLLCSVFYGWVYSPGSQFLNSYRQLRIGMSLSEVQRLFGPTPVYHCRTGGSVIWYFAGPGSFNRKFPEDSPEAGSLLSDATQLPNVYDHVQIAFDANDRLSAFTWIGETYTVEYSGGSVRGSHFKLLPPGSL